MEWLREARPGDRTYQDMLKDSQSRSTVRKAMRMRLKELTCSV